MYNLKLNDLSYWRFGSADFLVTVDQSAFEASEDSFCQGRLSGMFGSNPVLVLKGGHFNQTAAHKNAVTHEKKMSS